MRQLLPALITIFALSVSCGSEKKIDREVFEQVQQAHEVKRVSEADVYNEALKWGNEISGEMQEQLMGTLQKAMEEHGVAGAVEFCNVSALPMLKDLGDKHGVSIRRVSNDFRNPADKPNKEEQPLLDAYEYNEANKLKYSPNIQKSTDGKVLLYTKAITIPGKLCLNCHGEPGKDINAEVMDKINRLYPEDKATGHREGDLRGMWSIAMPQKAVVNRL